MTTATNYEIGKVIDFVEMVRVPVQPRPQPQHWYFIRVHPLMERRATETLLRRGVEVYAPTFEHQVRVQRHWRLYSLPKTRRVRSPLFPGIIFVADIDADVPRLKDYSQDVVGLLKFGEFPARLDERLYEQVRELERSMAQPLSKARLAVALKVGAQVRVREGAGHPLEMWTGRIQRLDGKRRLRILLDVVKREVSMERDQVEPV